MKKAGFVFCISILLLLLSVAMGEALATAIKLTDNNAEDIHPDWSPDGSKIVFVSNRDGSIDIWVMNADGSNPVKLTGNLPYDDCMDEEYWPTWSNDGSKIAFFVKNVTYCSDYQAYYWEVWVMDADGSNKHKLFTVNWGTTPDLTSPLSDIAWSPDDTKLLFHGFPAEGGNEELFVYDIANGTFTKIDPQGEDNPYGFIEGVSWSIQNKIAYGRYPCGIYVFDYTGNTTPQVSLLVESHEWEGGRVAMEPDWSSGNLLAFFNMSIMTNVTNQICVYDVASSKVVFTYDLGTTAAEWIGDPNPVISPDGSKVAFVMKDEDGDMEIYVVNVTQGEAANYLPDKNFTKVVDGKVYEINYRTALGVLEKASELGLLTYKLKSWEWGLFVDCIDGICSGDAGATSGWMYWVNYPNESMPMVSADSYTVHPGDTVTWYFAKTWEDTPETSTCVVNIHINSDYTIEVSKNCVKPITPVASVTIYPSSSTVSPDSTTTINVLIDAVPTGLSYANITVKISNSSVAEITNIEFPTWAALTDNSQLPSSTVWFKAGDLSDQVKAGDTNVVLATLTIKGLNPGTSDITITVNSFQNDSYQNIKDQIATISGTITVITGPPPIDGNQPMDLNNDGLFEDVNGDGYFNFGDIVFFFKNFDKPEIKNYPQFYDFNNDGSVNFGDVVALFKML